MKIELSNYEIEEIISCLRHSDCEYSEDHSELINYLITEME